MQTPCRWSIFGEKYFERSRYTEILKKIDRIHEYTETKNVQAKGIKVQKFNSDTTVAPGSLVGMLKLKRQVLFIITPPPHS